MVRHWKTAAAFVLPVIALLWLGARALPASEDDIRSSACIVSGHTDLCVVAGKDTIVVMCDTVQEQGVWIDRHWWRPSCKGHVLTLQQGRAFTDRGAWLTADSLPGLIAAQTDSLGALLQRKDTERKELQYYLRCHGVQDEGYQRIAEYADIQARETDSLAEIHRVLSSCRRRQAIRLLRIGHYTVTWHDSNGQWHRTECEPAVTPVGQVGKPLVIQTVSRTKPKHVQAVRRLPWTAAKPQDILTVKAMENDSVHPVLLIEGSWAADGRHNLPRLFATDGSAVFTRHGYFIGLISDKTVYSIE